MSQPTTCAVFAVDELWLLQSVIRHETAQQEQWHFPPASHTLNDQVAEALIRCHDNGLADAAVLITRADCLAIDYCVPQGAKSPAGAAIGKSVLLKSFHARRVLEEGPEIIAEEPEQLTAQDISEQLRHMNGE